MEVEEQAVKHKPFLGPIPNAQQRAEALEYIKRCSDNNYSDYSEDELVKSVNFIAKASAKSHGEDNEALQALTPLLTTDKVANTQIVHAAFYVLAISALHGNDVPLSTVRAAEAKLDDDPTLYDFCKRAREYCRVRTNKNRGMTNFIDLSEALRKHIGAGDTAAFCEKFAALCDAPAIEGDAVPLFERLLRLCALQQNAEFLNPQLAQKAISHVFASDLCEDMAILGSAMYFAAKTETQEFVDIDRVAKVCKTQLVDMKKKPTKGLFEGIFLFVSSSKFDKEEPKHKAFANDMFQLFVAVLDRIVLYEDVTKTFTEVHRCGKTISFDVPFKSLVNIQERPFISNTDAGSILDDDTIDTAVLTRLLAVATFIRQLYPSVPAISIVLLDNAITKKVLTTFCAGIPMLRKQKSAITVVNAFSTAFRLIYTIVQPVKIGFSNAFKEIIAAEFPKESTDKDAWDMPNLASVVQEKRHVVNSLCMIFCAFLAHWSDRSNAVTGDMTAYLHGLLLMSFYCDSTESALFIRTILRANNISMADKKAVYATMFNRIMDYMYGESSDNGVIARFSGALSTMDAEEINTLFDDTLGDVLIALFNSILGSYSVKPEDKHDNNDDDDDAMELSDSEKENTDAKAVNISNLVFSCRSLTNKFSALVVDTVKDGPGKLFVLPRSVCAHIMKSFAKEADDYLAQKKREKEEEEKKQKQAKGDTNEVKDVPKDIEVPEGVFWALSEMGMDKYQVQVTANRLGNTNPEEIASYYFENSERVNAMADERRIVDMTKREAEEAEARRKAEEEAKNKDVEMRDDDDDDGEVFEFPRHVVAVFELMKLFPALSARYPANRGIISNTAVKVAAEYGAYSKDNIFTMLRYLTTKFDPELKQPFTMKLLVDLTRTVATRKTKVDVADDGEEMAIVQSIFAKITALFTQKLEALAKEGEGDKGAAAEVAAGEGGAAAAFNVEDFAEWFGSFVDVVLMPLSYFDYENADVLIAGFRDNIYSLTPITRLLPEESIAAACVTVINAIARHWAAFTSKTDGDGNLLLLEGVLSDLATCINAVRNTPGITRADIAPLVTILANSCEEGHNSSEDSTIRPLSQGCVRQLCRVFAAFASHTADDVIRMICRICEAFDQFEGRTDVFNACFDPLFQFEDVRAFVIAGGVALDIGKNGEGFVLRRNCGQADFLASSTVTALVDASRARRTAILDAISSLCAAGNGVAQTVGAYLWMALPTMTGDRRLSQYVARFVCGKCADLVGQNESLVLKNSIKEFFTAITESETQIDFKNFVEFVLQKVVKRIRHKAQREAFMGAFMEFNEATEILGSLAKLQHPTAWLFLRVIVNMHLKKAESVLRLISDAEDISKSAGGDGDDTNERRKDKKGVDYGNVSMSELANMSEEEQIEFITMLSARGYPPPSFEPSPARNRRMRKPDYWPELEERVLFMKSGPKIPESVALEAVQEHFDEEETIDAHFAAATAETATTVKDLQLPKRVSSKSIEIKYAMITVKMLYTAIANDVFVGDLATAGASKGKDDNEVAARYAAYEAEVAAVKANFESFIEALPPSMKQEVMQSLEEEIQNLRRKYNITGDGDGNGGGNGPRNGYDAVYARVMQVARGAGSRCYANNSTDAFQNSQLPAESEVPILTPVEVENYVGLVLECGRRDAAALDGVLLPCILLLGLCKPTRDALYGKLVAVFAECAQKNGRVARAMADKVLKEILLPKNSKVYGADAILLNAGRVRTLIEAIAPFTAETENASAVREMYELLKRLTERMVPQQQLGGGHPGSNNNSIECVEVSEFALECIVNCNGVKSSDVEEVILRLAGNKANMGVLLNSIRGKLVALVKEEVGELDKTADLILKKEIDGYSDLKGMKLFERSGELEAQLKFFCRITSLTMRGVNPNRNKPSAYLGDYVIHCNFDDLGLDDLCDGVERVLENIETVCPELAPDKKSGSDDDDDAIDVVAPPQKVPANGTDADPFHRISEILSRQEALIAQHKREIDELISQYQEQHVGPQPPPSNVEVQPQPVPLSQVIVPPPSPPQPVPVSHVIVPPPPQQPQPPQPPQPFIPIPQLPHPPPQPFIPMPQPPQPPQPFIPQMPHPPPQQLPPPPPPFIIPPMGPMFGNTDSPIPPPSLLHNNRPSFSSNREQRQQEEERSRRERRLNDIRQRLSVTQDVEDASMLLEALIDTYQTNQQTVPHSVPPRVRTEITSTLSVLNFVEAIVVSMKFVVGFTGDRNELFREVMSYYTRYFEMFMRVLLRAHPCASSKCSSIIEGQEALALELRTAVTERAEALGVMNRSRFMGDDDGDSIIVRRKPFTNVVIALANLLDIVYITETSRSRLEYEKRHENEAEESNLLCLSISSGSLSGEVVGTQSLFKEHEKLFSLILNGDLWLIGGALRGLVVNVPSLVSFEDKVRWFQNELDKKRRSLRSNGSLRITVNRMNLFEDSFRQMMGPIEDLRGRLRVDFRDEGGTDAGGLMREWFNEIAVEIANQQYGLFKPSDDSAIQPNPKALFANEGAIEYFKFVGRIVGKTIWDRQLLDVHFTRSFYKQILGRSVNAKDMESVDRTIYESLRCIYDNHITEDDYIFFSETVNQFGETEDVPLIPGGENIPVTDENKAAFINLKVQFLLVDSIKDFLAAFMRGFNEFIDQDLIAPFTENQLELLISGMPTIDVADMRRHTVYSSGYNANSEQIVWFWEVVGGFNEEEKAMLLQFITGSSKVPTGGFANLRIKITMTGRTSKLPLAHTCFNELELPKYETFEELKKKLTTAVVYGCVGFGFS